MDVVERAEAVGEGRGGEPLVFERAAGGDGLGERGAHGGDDGGVGEVGELELGSDDVRRVCVCVGSV